MTLTPALQLRNISKTFTGQLALDDVTLDIPRGQVTALLGMNGSGKSTLIKILAGIYEPDPGGSLIVGDEELALPLSPARAYKAGLRFLHQDLGLIDMLTVADNFALSDGFKAAGVIAPIKRREHLAHAKATLELLDIDVDPSRLVKDLSPSERTMVGIARAFQSEEANVEALQDKILILDEPTASLPEGEADRVLDIVDRLRSYGGTAIYVSHRIEEVIEIADYGVILRDGRLMVEEPIDRTRTAEELVSLIVGRQLSPTPMRDAEIREGDTLLKATGLYGNRLNNVDLSVRSGEVVGVTGLIGCGRSELIRILAGAQERQAGTMTLGGQDYAPSSAAEAIGLGVTCVPQDRRRDGVVLDLSVGENLTLGRLNHFAPRLAVKKDQEKAHVEKLMTDFLVKASSAGILVRTLSGGNQQKVVVARAASFHPRLLLLDEPSQGVDALAKQEITNLLRALADSGVAIVVASTDYSDFPGLAARVIILNRGHLTGELTDAEITEDNIALATQRTVAV